MTVSGEEGHPRADELTFVVDDAYTNISPNRQTVMSFDREGRMMGYFYRGMTYRRNLASRVVVRWREDGRRQRRWLNDSEAHSLFVEVYNTAAAIAQKVAANSRRDGAPTLLARLQNDILPWTPAKLAAQRHRFDQVYTPIPILPPDQYQSIVVQATQGCTWNRCTFCNFYQGQRFQMRPLAHFDRHIDGVKNLFGRGLALRRGIFIGDGNALAVKPARLMHYIERIQAAFGDEPLYGFVDVFSGERHSRDEWQQLAEAGLTRVYIGMETGHDPLLRFLNKPGSREETVGLVRDLKSVGIAVSPIVMVGIGGRQFAQVHAADTMAALADMHLAKGDLLYVSPFVEHGDSVYKERREAENLQPMSADEVEAELKRWASQARAMGIQTGRYDIRDFIY